MKTFTNTLIKSTFSFFIPFFLSLLFNIAFIASLYFITFSTDNLSIKKKKIVVKLYKVISHKPESTKKKLVSKRFVTRHIIKNITRNKDSKLRHKKKIKNKRTKIKPKKRFSPPINTSISSLKSAIKQNKQTVKLPDMRVLQNQVFAGAKKIKKQVNTLRAAYINYIKQIINSGNKQYPYSARIMEMEGTVQIGFTIKQNGSVKKIIVKKSSGFTVLDKAAIKYVKKTAHFKPAPFKIADKGLYLSVSIQYKLDTSTVEN